MKDMKKMLGLALAAVFAWTSGALADKTADAFVDPASVAGGTNGFHNQSNTCDTIACVKDPAYSVGASKLSGGKIKVSFKNLVGFATGEKMICLAGADASFVNGLFFGNTIVMVVPYDPALLKGGTKADAKDIGGGGLNAISVDALNFCYKWDTAIANPSPYIGALPSRCSGASDNPGALCDENLDCPNGACVAGTCAAAGGLWVPNLTYVPGSESTDGLVGLCQFFANNARLPPPASGLVARSGVTNPQTIPNPE